MTQRTPKYIEEIGPGARPGAASTKLDTSWGASSIHWSLNGSVQTKCCQRSGVRSETPIENGLGVRAETTVL